VLRPWTVPFREAIRATGGSIGNIAADCGYARVTFDTYINRREPSRAAALALAQMLEQRSEQLRDHAERLREAAVERASQA